MLGNKENPEREIHKFPWEGAIVKKGRMEWEEERRRGRRRKT